MSDTINLYPKTSCPCEQIENKYNIAKGFNSNLAVNACNIPNYFNLFNTAEFGKDTEPVEESKIYSLNPQVYSTKYSPDFGEFQQKMPKGCCEPTYMSRDPRLYSPTRYEYLPLDRPPINGNVKLKDVYDKQYDNYGCGFTPYENIRDGQIEYYIDKSISKALYTPVFSEPSKVDKVLYRDPMGAMKPQYTRSAIFNTMNPTTTIRDDYPSCLSFLQDTQSYREDIMSYQQRKNNQQRWEPRWV